jgi:FKBP-type peptidyl-prolyl cis-trans isomerase FklB
LSAGAERSAILIFPEKIHPRCRLVMNRTSILLGLVAVSFLGGCAPKEPEPAVPVRDETAIRREWLYGARAAAADIDWRPSGLGIRLIAPGEGTPPTSTDRIRVHYVLTLKDGRVIDDSHAKGKPSDFTVNRLLTGWAEGMAKLRPGGRAEFFIPPSLGYGNMSAGGIPSGSGLIFEVELIAVNPEVPPKS